MSALLAQGNRVKGDYGGRMVFIGTSLWLFIVAMGILRPGGQNVPRILYNIAFYLLVPFICLRLLWRGRRVPGYLHRWHERFGFVPEIAGSQPVIWVHSVSVGETIAAAPLIRGLQSRFPDVTWVVTTSTPTGSDRVKALFGDSVYHVYAPYDTSGAIARFVRRIRPDLLIIMETELWPNMIDCCHRQGIPVVVANARLSQKSANGYRRFLSLTRPMLRKLSAVAAQSRSDGERFLALGLQQDQLFVTGNIKFDLEISHEQIAQAEGLRGQWQGLSGRQIFLAASTHQGEDEIVLDAFAVLKKRFPGLLLVLVPRHPDRFNQVAVLCQSRGFVVTRRSAGQLPDSKTDILLGDTMGELPVLLGAGDVAFVGGSLVPVGGHNLMEPAAWGIPILSGPHLFNFSETSKLLREAGAVTIVQDALTLSEATGQLLSQPALAQDQGKAAQHVVATNRGALTRLIEIIENRWPT